MALSRSDAEMIRGVVRRLRAEHDERAASAIERLMNQVAQPNPPVALANYMTTGEASRLIGVSLQTIKNWVDQGRLVGARVGGRTLVSRASVQAFFDALGAASVPEDHETDDLAVAELADREVMESLPAKVRNRVDTLLRRSRSGEQLSASESRELRRLAREGTAAATRRMRTLAARRRRR
jgi:excisionase family DNA binding protein